IRTGEISQWMLRPFHPVHRDIVQNITYKVLMMVILIPAVILLTILFRPDFSGTTFVTLLLTIPALLLAGALSFALGWIVGMVAFWTTRMQAINSLYYIIILFSAGQIAPLEVMPQAVQAIAAALPFRWVLAFPVEVFLGRIAPAQALTGYLIQGLWLAASVIIFNIMWRFAVRRYSAVGG